ncbi:hypothetical protein [Pseudoduganella violaceinigra]|uniref:hypothetical protein n=1 Tax=Pseudoduganella violaceinigra TaxID=246602 RepID=UPI000689168C|nr:hypothetical protein [Pseudoduganella violaceinigra]
MSVNKALSGKAFIFYPSRSDGDSSFVLPGTEFRKDSGGPPESVQFFIDGIHYQFLTTPKSQFIVDGEAGGDAAVLHRHTAYEREFIAKVGNPRSKFQEIGSRNRPAVEGTPALLFKLWQMKVPGKQGDSMQYYLTTVIGDDVVMLSAIILDAKYEARVMSALDSFTQTFQFIVSEKSCP